MSHFNFYPRITVIVGHRGVGKSAFLARLKKYDPQAITYDLDQEISKNKKQSVSQIFEKEGELAFRKLEQTVFFDLIKKHENENTNVFIALGAGFQIEFIPKDIKIFWIQRRTDQDGRIFLNRPRLEKDTTPLAEWQMRYNARQTKFASLAHEQYEQPEGLIFENENEKKFLFGLWQTQPVYMTLLPRHLRDELSIGSLKKFFSKKIFFEIRNDLLSTSEASKALELLKDEQILYSFRKTNHGDQMFSGSWQLDWALELGKPQSKFLSASNHKIISLHECKSIEEGVEQLNSYDSNEFILKFSPLVNNFNDLKIGLEWQSKKPAQRSFLPRSENGRWNWVRLYLTQKQPINFIRDGVGSALDQPTWYQFLNLPSQGFNSFAAVLGDPVYHSWSPVFHSDFFIKNGMPFFGINIQKHEWPSALTLLRQLGLKAMAVTSPLKEEAFNCCNEVSTLASELKAVNTLFIKGSKIIGHNTDYQGFSIYSEHFDSDQVIAVWGGGGTKAMLQRIIPEALYFSSRSQELSTPQSPKNSSLPEILIWAAPRTPETKFPPDSWKPKLIIDLNYKEDSMGIEYAQRINAKYISGERMFIAQAKEQQDWWNQQLNQQS